MRARLWRTILICAAAAGFAAGMLPDGDSLNDAQTPTFELLGDNEIPNSIIDDILEIGVDVLNFLARMVPGI
jgi:hypothetical protein